ncbi:MAG: HD domain-containing protein [Thermovirgaceae bacterium]|nr:HD domain-containing protein [Synergistales bacterium]MDI9391666.1 HD domain-containing protein [Synergistota bacterium]MDY0178612.1 HD domain-containing protein [Synergistaceae bacterium]HRW86913.1 HD domain-containing protein [Thermovirgaceae bacterium]MDD3829905.1 HD domain-containing protein [Synergistales bacterium]
MITPGLVETVFSAASMTRWNDHARPAQFTELAKQAHKMAIAWVIARCEEDQGGDPDWVRLVEGGLFEFFQRVVLTDIKPPVFHRMMERHGERLNRLVLDKLARHLESLGGGFFERFRKYLKEPDFSGREKRILRASHYLATNWEFRMIYGQNRELSSVEETRRDIEGQLEDHIDLAGVREMIMRRTMTDKGLYAFIDLCGQLRFQVRWAQLPRVPATSVLGHLFMAASLSYFVSLENGGCPRRLRNAFFGGLFHDLPEVLTRDIISPVKRSVEGLEELIKEYENESMETRLLPLIPEGWRKELRYLTSDEFSNRARDPVTGNIISGLTLSEMNSNYNCEEWDPVDGTVIDACDKLAAMVEAATSIRYGICPPALEEGRRDIFEKYSNTVIGTVDLGSLFGAFLE